MTMENAGVEFVPENKCELYIATMGEAAQRKAAVLTNDLRADGFFVETDTMNRGLKPQMKYANKIGAVFTMVLGDNELETGKAKLKNMETGEQTDIALDERFAENFYYNITSLKLKLDS